MSYHFMFTPLVTIKSFIFGREELQKNWFEFPSGFEGASMFTLTKVLGLLSQNIGLLV
jgi:hypothetical protein